MFENLRLLFLRFFIAVREINYPSYFIDYYEIHLKKNVLHLVIPLITQANPAVLGRILRVFAVDISENNVIRHGERKFVRRGWASMVHLPRWCILFTVCFLGVQCGWNTNKLDKLYKSPLTLWTSAISRFTKHASGKCEMHNLAVIAMGNFLRNMD